MIELCSESADDTRDIAATIAGVSRPGDLIVLAGQMGAGKTAFAQGFARQLGVVEPVTSPTYTLVHTYPALAGAGPNRYSLTLHHVDLYRLDHTTEVDDLALDELLDDASVMLVEWGDMVDLGPNLHVELRVGDDDNGDNDNGNNNGDNGDDSNDRREITITSSDRRWDLRWDGLAAALDRWSA